MNPVVIQPLFSLFFLPCICVLSALQLVTAVGAKGNLSSKTGDRLLICQFVLVGAIQTSFSHCVVI